MLFFSACKRVESWVDGAVRGELDASRNSQLKSHVASCAPCAGLYEEARRAEAVLATAVGQGDLEPLFSLAELDAMRARTLTAIRVMAVARREPDQAWYRAWAGALVAASIVGMAVLVAPREAVQVPVVAQNGADPAAANVATPNEMRITTTGTPLGTLLSWDREGAYRVVRTSSPNRNGGTLKVMTVCGSSWTDVDPPQGVVYYRVVPEASECPRGRA